MRTVSLMIGLMLLGITGPAFAYLDPSTGSMIVSAIVGAFATVVLVVKTYWYRLLRLFRRGDRKPSDKSSS